MKWLKYFQNIRKEQALKCGKCDAPVEYGEVVYQSAMFLGRRWLVTDFNGEYDVFLESERKPNELERSLAAAFNSKDRAIAFAAEMFLVSCGRLHRANRYKFDEDCKMS